MSSMKPLLAVALMVAGAILPASAQRGGSRGVSIGHSGGFAVHSAPPSRPSFPSIGRTPFMSAPQFRYGANREGNAPGRGPIAIDSNRRFGRPAVDRFRRPYLPFYGTGFAYAYPDYFDPGYLGYPDYGPYDDSAYATPQQPATYPAPDDYPAPPPEQAYVAPPPVYRPPYVRPQAAEDLGSETPVTLIFKDGRPSEQIQNYMLTRTTLYVQGPRLREIPVADLDLPATEKANKAAGIDFQLPGGPR